MLNKLTKISPIAGSLLVFCGVLKLIFYYSYFNIKIIEYLEFQEIITSFLGDINILIIFGFTMLLISFLFLNFIEKKIKLPIDEIIEKTYIFLYPRRFRYSFFFFSILLFQILIVKLKIIDLNYVVIYFMAFCTIQTLTYLFFHKENEKVEIPTFYGTLIISISICFSLYLFSRHDIDKTIKNDNNVIVFSDIGTFNCNNVTKNIFIGKTNKFVFVFIDSNKSSVVIPEEKINRIDINS